MSELDLAYRIARRLDAGTEQLSPYQRERLFAARQGALARRRVSPSLLSLAGIGHITHDILLPQLRLLLTAMLLSACVLGSYYWNTMEQAAENEEVDVALLSDDLPPNAYLDHGFDTWLKGSISQHP